MKRLVLLLLFIWPVCVSSAVPKMMDWDFILNRSPKDPSRRDFGDTHFIGFNEGPKKRKCVDYPGPPEREPSLKKKGPSSDNKNKIRKASSFFEKWIIEQYVYDEKLLTLCKSCCREEFGARIAIVDPLHRPFVRMLLGGKYLDGEVLFPNTQNLDELFTLLCRRDSGFVELLKQLSFNSTKLAGKDTYEYEKDKIKEIISRYVNLAGILFFSRNFVERNQFNFNLANHFFEYIFSWDGKSLNPIFKEEKNYSILRFMYSVIHRFLVDDGWIHWSHETFKRLKEKAKEGSSITYIAGGCDIYQLVTNGIYNVTIIDPFIPSQKELYYVNNALWFVDGAIGDELVFDNIENQKVIIMRRNIHASFNKDSSIKTSKDGAIRIPKTTTIWGLYNYKGEKIGDITFQRRLCTQEDFNNTVVLMSLNEALLAFSPKSVDGWEMQTSKLPSDFCLHVKQLHGPIGTLELKNYLKVQRYFSFIDLCTLGS